MKIVRTPSLFSRSDHGAGEPPRLQRGDDAENRLTRSHLETVDDHRVQHPSGAVRALGEEP